MRPRERMRTRENEDQRGKEDKRERIRTSERKSGRVVEDQNAAQKRTQKIGAGTISSALLFNFIFKRT